ncbi:hypothetical protein MNEG_11660 [Monoraphidium neglectum]|uniref:Uncharacterized protein n=1 Tax=Monoraphidium neglectum TaxID=145388 RepID=A0A0D2LY15_9CHLO|nr:hypothetical protein MNEG_11660 [Monoraphidium neglectum]KIY96299.1 hypothetical protein MNEG_11660 [Monoraphidium neglectum]|eukprot:XP_013895319.1 hypothetical protein MNEG_11660 [Monoraphidium neglectum]
MKKKINISSAHHLKLAQAQQLQAAPPPLIAAAERCFDARQPEGVPRDHAVPIEKAVQVLLSTGRLARAQAKGPGAFNELWLECSVSQGGGDMGPSAQCYLAGCGGSIEGRMRHA